MNSKIFNEWLDSWNADLIKMNRKILLVMGNFSGHLKYTDKCSNIELLFLPPNTTSKSQPLDAGIIKAFKDRYKKLLHDYLYKKLISNDSGLAGALKSYSLLDAIKNVNEAWNSLPESSIVNCWKHTQIATVYDETVEIIDDDHTYFNNNSL